MKHLDGEDTDRTFHLIIWFDSSLLTYKEEVPSRGCLMLLYLHAAVDVVDHREALSVLHALPVR